MEISFSPVNRSIPPQSAGVDDHAVAPKKASDGWMARETGAAELTKVAGEESIDEKALARDDDLGKLMSKAFDPASALQALPALGIGD